MLIKIVRMWFSKESTQGVISIDGTKCGFTLEDTCRPFGVKVDGATAIPEGEYEVTIDYSEKFKKLMPHILDVPLFEGVRIHCGNYADHIVSTTTIPIPKEYPILNMLEKIEVI